jgi:hypothetical protein
MREGVFFRLLFLLWFIEGKIDTRVKGVMGDPPLFEDLSSNTRARSRRHDWQTIKNFSIHLFVTKIRLIAGPRFSQISTVMYLKIKLDIFLPDVLFSILAESNHFTLAS